MSNRLYVGNFPYSTTEEELRDLFSSFGEISELRLMIDRDTGKPKGFAFIEFREERCARDAIAQLHDTNFGGRRLVVSIANAQKPRAREEHRPDSGRNGRGRHRDDY